MRYNRLGNTGLFVSELCLGTMTLQTLDAASALPAEYPGWMIERQGEYRQGMAEA
jgi:aryl-alcohol dehydrogenase-like predicted oxidoreductase